VTRFERSQFARDLAAMLALSDARKADVRARQASCKANPELTAALLAQAQRSGQREIDWPEYFRNIGAHS